MRGFKLFRMSSGNKLMTKYPTLKSEPEADGDAVNNNRRSLDEASELTGEQPGFHRFQQIRERQDARCFRRSSHSASAHARIL